MMFIQVYVIQCQSTGEFVTRLMNYSKSLSRAGIFTDRNAAVDTGFNDLGDDFQVHTFYMKEHELPAYCSGWRGLPDYG
jgi:hypothetical protein